MSPMLYLIKLILIKKVIDERNITVANELKYVNLYICGKIQLIHPISKVNLWNVCSKKSALGFHCFAAVLKVGSELLI